MKRFLGINLGLAVLLGIVNSTTYASGFPLVLNTAVNSSAGTLTINGQNFGSSPVVSLNNYSFPVVQPTGSNQIVATFPTDKPLSTFPPGTYLLTLTFKNQLPSIFTVVIGANGIPGPQGPIGFTGAVGPQGPAGLQGPAGPQGFPGPVGLQGPIGLIGPAGPAGPAGLAGAIGPAGPAGAAGPPGAQGPQGLQGQQGPAGPPGPPGAAGSSGSCAGTKTLQQIATLQWRACNITVAGGIQGLGFDGIHIWGTTRFPTVLQFDLAGNLTGTFPVGNVPQAIAFDGQYLWVTNGSIGNVTLITQAGVFADAFVTGQTVTSFPSAVAFDGTRIWVANYYENTVWMRSNVTLGGGQDFPVGKEPVALATDGANIWVANSGDNTVSKLGPSGTVLGTFPVGPKPVALAFDGGHMWVANGGNSTVSELDLSGGVLASYSLPSIPTGAMTFDGTHVWVATNSGLTRF